MRRALRRAADGLTLDATEAAVLLAARGDDLDRLTRLAVLNAFPGTHHFEVMAQLSR